MKNSTFLSAKEKEECIVRYKDGESIRKLSKEYKHDYSVIFNKEAVDEINQNDALQVNIPNVFFTIIVLTGLYLRINPGNYPVCLTPYFSVAIKFQTLKEANSMIKNLISNNMRWKPKVIEVRNGIPI